MTSNINQGALTHAALLDDLSSLHTKLKQAEAERDNGAAMLARHDIDCALDRLNGVASEAEFGPMGTAPT